MAFALAETEKHDRLLLLIEFLQCAARSLNLLQTLDLFLWQGAAVTQGFW